MYVHTVIAKKARGFLRFDRNKGPNKVVDDSRDQDNKQEDLGLHRSTIFESVTQQIT